ncbi:hypothetical protein SDC9_188027 [bioreactor metagenome]|uniref:Uncharacterized protein n=1 Tax=bioreactor metagenome TaxID=1076179 RepID=A0A645HQH1_9ZZZZ
MREAPCFVPPAVQLAAGLGDAARDAGGVEHSGEALVQLRLGCHMGAGLIGRDNAVIIPVGEHSVQIHKRLAPRCARCTRGKHQHVVIKAIDACPLLIQAFVFKRGLLAELAQHVHQFLECFDGSLALRRSLADSTRGDAVLILETFKDAIQILHAGLAGGCGVGTGGEDGVQRETPLVRPFKKQRVFVLCGAPA